MFELDHVALNTTDIASSVHFYTTHFGAQVLYEDATWALLSVGHGKLALVSPGQHPPHVAFRVDESTLLREASRLKGTIDSHRDGSRGFYLQDPQGNAIELICYPADPADYADPE